MDEPDFARFALKMNFGRINYKAGDILGLPYNEYHRNSLTYGVWPLVNKQRKQQDLLS